MNTAFRECFDADLSVIRDAALLRRIRKVIEHVEAAENFQQIPNLKRLEASGKYYRIRIGDYRIGLVFERGTLTFVPLFPVIPYAVPHDTSRLHHPHEAPTAASAQWTQG